MKITSTAIKILGGLIAPKKDGVILDARSFVAFCGATSSVIAD